MAIVGDPKWAESTTLFVGKGFRKFPIEYFGLDERARAEAWLQEAGAISTYQRKAGRGLSHGQHQSGTCRMGHDPKTSVVDATCRVHDVPNVFVADASVHVTNGGFNPVLTIFANAFRVSALMVEAWKGGGLRG